MRWMAILLFLTACSSKTPPPSKQQEFENKHLLFDVTTEEAHFDCPIQGKIPEWLSGTLLRNGPAKFTVGDQRVNSWFDGLAMIYAFSFSPHHVYYGNRFLRSKQYYEMVVEKTMDFSGFAQDPCGSAFRHQTSKFIPSEMKDIQNAVVSIATYADQMVALTETPLPVVFDPETLVTVGPFQYEDHLPKSQIFESAHPQHDAETINYQVQFGKTSKYVVWRLKGEEREVLVEIPVDLPSYMHSFALTEKYVILVEFPFVVNPIDLVVKNKPFIKNFQWKPERGTTFLVVERTSGNVVATLKTEPFFAFHHVNAFDRGDEIVIDTVVYPDAAIIELVTGSEEYEKDNPSLHRFVLSLKERAVKQEALFEKLLEMPRVAPAVVARPYRFCYAVDYKMPTSSKEVRPLYKIDVETKQVTSWAEEGCFPGEPIFVPHPEQKGEDEGVVLAVILDYMRHRSFLLMLDAKTFKEVARMEAPHAIPVGLHGQYVPSH